MPIAQLDLAAEYQGIIFFPCAFPGVYITSIRLDFITARAQNTADTSTSGYETRLWS